MKSKHVLIHFTWGNFFFSPQYVSQEKELEKQKLLYQQARLHQRGASEMVLQIISASKGKAILFFCVRVEDSSNFWKFPIPSGHMCSMIAPTLKLGIALLSGGNATVQQVQFNL